VEFANNKARHDGLQSYCRECMKNISKEWISANPQKHAKQSKRKRLKYFYKMTLEEYDRIWEAQSGVCPGCLGPCEQYTNLSVDHSHVTGKVRGLLCRDCNLALGICRDDPDRLRRLADYLEQAEAQGEKETDPDPKEER
jgi:hypothetical protein